MTKIAVSFQNLLLAHRLDHLAEGQVVVGHHRGRRRLAGAVPMVWSFGSRTICSRGISPFFLEPLQFAR